MRLTIFFTAVLLFCVTLCSAGPTIGDPQVTLTFLTANPPGNEYNGAYYAYPYSVLVGTGPGASAVPMMCDDFTDDINGQDSWLSTAYSLTQTNLANDVTDFKYGNQTTFGPGNVYDTTSAVTAYEEAAYILTNVALGNFSPSEGNAAVWYLFSDTSSIAGDTTARGLLDTAYAFVTDPNNSNYDYSNVTVYTQGTILSGQPGDIGHASQEFLGFAAPEPPPSLLLVIGFALIGAAGLKRRKQVVAQVVKPRSDC